MRRHTARSTSRNSWTCRCSWCMSRPSEAIAEIRRAQDRGQRIYGETCPQYLFLTAADLELRRRWRAPSSAVAPRRSDDRPPRRPSGSGLAQRHLPGVLLRSRAVSVTTHRASSHHGTECVLQADSERRARARAAPAAAVLGRGLQGGRIDHQPVRRARLRPTPRSMYGLVPAQGHHRCRCGRRPRDLGSRDARSTVGYCDVARSTSATRLTQGRRITGWPDHGAQPRPRGGRRWHSCTSNAGSGAFLPCDKPERGTCRSVESQSRRWIRTQNFGARIT